VGAVGQDRRRNELVREGPADSLPGGARQHVHLHLAPGVLVFLQQVQAGLQLAVGRFQLLAIALVLDPQARTVQRAAYRMLQHREVFQRFDQVIGSAETQGFDGIVHHPGAGNHDHRDFDAKSVDSSDQLQTIDLRHAQIADHQVGAFLLEHFQPLQTVVGLQHLEAAVLEVGREACTYDIVVIDDQQGGTGFVHGVSRQTAPGKLWSLPLARRRIVGARAISRGRRYSHLLADSSRDQLSLGSFTGQIGGSYKSRGRAHKKRTGFMSQNDRAYSEKRDYIRMRLDAAVVLHHAGQEIPALCLDLSSTGMQIEAEVALSTGDKVKVHIPSEHSELAGLDAQAEVVRVTDLGDGRQSLGLAITSMS